MTFFCLSFDISKGRYSDGLCIQLKVGSCILSSCIWSRFITLDSVWLHWIPSHWIGFKIRPRMSSNFAIMMLVQCASSSRKDPAFYLLNLISFYYIGFQWIQTMFETIKPLWINLFAFLKYWSKYKLEFLNQFLTILPHAMSKTVRFEQIPPHVRVSPHFSSYKDFPPLQISKCSCSQFNIQ